MASDHSVGFEPADRLAEDRESLRRRFWSKLKRVAAQLPTEDKASQADFVIRTDGSFEETDRQVEHIWRTLSPEPSSATSI